FVRHFDACLGCMACVTACPSGVQYAPLIEATRAQIERRHARSVADRLFRAAIFAIFPYPARMRLALLPLALLPSRSPERLALPRTEDGSRDRSEGARALQATGEVRLKPDTTYSAQTLQATSEVRLKPDTTYSAQGATRPTVIARIRAALSLAPTVTLRSLFARVPERTPARGGTRMTVGVLTGCVQRLVFPQVNAATVDVLAAEGCDVVAPADQGCCGALALHAGRLDDAREFARRTIEIFERAGVERIAVNAAGCGSSMKEYGHLLAG